MKKIDLQELTRLKTVEAVSVYRTSGPALVHGPVVCLTPSGTHPKH